MSVFFALSGFLITALLVEERSTTGRVSLRNFFARRALRLLPALGFFLTGWLAVVLATRGHSPWTTTVPGGGTGTGTSPLVALEGVGGALLYVTNWAEIWGWFSGYVPLGHLWSLAVEEQFYLLWSPVVALILSRRSRAMVGWAAGLAAAASFIDVALRDGHGMSLVLDMSTDARAGSFLVGAALSVAWTQRAPWLRALHGRGQRITAVGCLLVLGWGSWVFDHGVSRSVFTLAWAAVSVAAGLIVVAFLGDGPGAAAWDRGLPGRDIRRSTLLWPVPLALRVVDLAWWHGPTWCAARARRVLRVGRSVMATRRATGTGTQAPLHLDPLSRSRPARGPCSGIVAISSHGERMTVPAVRGSTLTAEGLGRG